MDAPYCYHIDTSGLNNTYTSYEFKLRGPVTAPITTVSSVGQDVSGFLVGATYMLTYETWWTACDSNLGDVNIKLNGQSVANNMPCSGSLGGFQSFGPFTAVSTVENLTFEFVVNVGQPQIDIRIDNVVITEI